MKNKKNTEERFKLIIDNFNAMLDECKSIGINRINIKVGDYEYSHPIHIKLKLKTLINEKK